MSEISSRPRVLSVSSAVLTSNSNVSAGATGAAVAGAALTVAVGGAILAAGVIALMVRGLSSAARAAYRECSESLQEGSSVRSNRTSTELIQPISALRENHRLHQQQVTQAVARHSLSQTEAIQVSTLLTVASTPYRVENSSAIQQPLEALRLSTSPDAALSAGQQLVATLEQRHHTVFVQALTLACTNASLKVGFDSIETQTGPTGAVRVIACDPSGRSLVTEISAHPHRDPRIETEVVGVSDGSCHALLDAFDHALEEEGVRSEAPKRRFTGGVCELQAAREFVRKKVKRTPATHDRQTPAERTDNAVRRGQRLNAQKNPQKQR